ncbi:MAG: hypothetical protein ACI8XG_001852 [Congregibacter sp.]|jgi:hypothetical protein
MDTRDTRFSLIADNGDILYPYKKTQQVTQRYGFALTKVGEQDREGAGTYTDDISEVIRKVVFDGWSVRVKSYPKSGEKVREGTLGFGKRSIVNYEIADELRYIVANAPKSPKNALSDNIEVHANDSSSIETEISDDLSNSKVDEKVLQSIKTRRGQPAFRKALLEAYGGTCCITGCTVQEVLEAAHITPHGDETNYSVYNGLLLRADVHTLFDLGLLRFNGAGVAHVDDTLNGSEYCQYEGHKLVEGGVPIELAQNLQKRWANN